MKDNFYITIETYHIGDRGRIITYFDRLIINWFCSGEQHNVHELENKRLKDREVVKIDIANDAVNAADYKKDEDPKIFKSEKTGRGPLSGDWRSSVEPVMTAYKLVTVQFKW